jgi:putative two-component system response regulator
VPLLAQIIGVVDVFDAVTTVRPYQPTLSMETALQLLRDQVERGWRQPEIVETFAGVIRSGQVGAFTQSYYM